MSAVFRGFLVTTHIPENSEGGFECFNLVIFRNYSPLQASEMLKIIWTNISAYVIVELSSNRSEGIYYGLSKSHSERYYETV